MVTFSLRVTHLLVLSVHWCIYGRDGGELRWQKAIRLLQRCQMCFRSGCRGSALPFVK